MSTPNWSKVDPALVVSECSSANIEYLLSDAKSRIASLGGAVRLLGENAADAAKEYAANMEAARAEIEALREALENLANAASATPDFASPMFLKDARDALALAKGGDA